MAYASSSIGTAAKKIGRYCRYIATACRRASVVLCCWDAGRIGKMSDALSSSAKILEATFTNSRARCLGLQCAVAR